MNTGQWSGTHVALFPIVDCTLTTPSYHYQHPLRGGLQYALTLSTIVSMMPPSCGGVQWLSSNLLIVCGCFFCSSPQFIFSPSVCPCRDQEQGSGQSRLGHLCERSAVGHHVNTTQCTLGFCIFAGEEENLEKRLIPTFFWTKIFMILAYLLFALHNISSQLLLGCLIYLSVFLNVHSAVQLVNMSTQRKCLLYRTGCNDEAFTAAGCCHTQTYFQLCVEESWIVVVEPQSTGYC